jgi:Tfp pilus assembly protein PilO
MWKTIDQKTLKMIGVYIILLLAIFRFAVYPLQDSVGKGKIIFTELNDAFQLKVRHLERRGQDMQKPVKSWTDKDVILPYLYEKGMPFSAVQTDILENVIKSVEKKGLVVQNFEILEPVTGKTISEVPFVIRMSGKPINVLQVLQTIVSEGKFLEIKTLEINKSGPELLLNLNLTVFRSEK